METSMKIEKGKLVVSIPETILKLTPDDFTESDTGKQYSNIPQELNAKFLLNGYVYGIYCRIYKNSAPAKQRQEKPDKKKLNSF